MTSQTGNAQAKKENRGSDSPNIELQRREERDPNKSNGRDTIGRKGGDNTGNM
jgi:hypothetical protein